MKYVWKNYLFAFVFSGFILEGSSAAVGIRPNVYVSPKNEGNPLRVKSKIKSSDVSFDVRTAKINRGMFPTLETFASEVSILVNNLYKRRELDEVNVRSLMRIRFYLAYVYQAIQNPTTTQEKLKKRIVEAVREINEELAHRLDFEERYKGGLINIPTGKSTSTFGTQTEDKSVDSSRSSSESGSDEPIANRQNQSSLSPDVTARLRAAAQRARDPVASKGGIVPENSSSPEDLSKASTRTRALVKLINSGKIPIGELSKKDRDLVLPYLEETASGNSNQPKISNGIQGISFPPPPPPPPPSLQESNLVQDRFSPLKSLEKEGVPESSGGAPKSREGLPARTQALLNFVESGKIPLQNLSPKDQALIRPYLKETASDNSSQPKISNGIQGISFPPPPPPPPSLQGSNLLQDRSSPLKSLKEEGAPESSGGAPKSREGLPARTQALLGLVDNGGLPIQNLSSKDLKTVCPYVNGSGSQEYCKTKGL